MTQAPVQNKSEVKERLMQQAEQPWAFGVERIGLFGSFARDEAGLQSDVDLFVDIATERKTLKHGGSFALPACLAWLKGGTPPP
jgi:predicted nucleotidyltransferase